jgi:hypothetical protein
MSQEQEFIQSNAEKLKAVISNFQIEAMKLGYSTLTLCVNKEVTQIDTSGNTDSIEDMLEVQRYNMLINEFAKYNNQQS